MAARKSPSNEAMERVHAAIAKINRDAKAELVTTADKVPYYYGLRRPSGIMQLDLDTGGGFPAGGVCCLSGPDGVGKSDFLYRYMAWQQRIYGEECCLALVHVEHQFDHFRLRRLGVKVPVPLEHIEQEQKMRKHRGTPLLTKAEIADLQTGIGHFYLIPPADMETQLQVVIELLKSGGFHIIGVDSISAMIPSDTDGKDLDEATVRGAHAMCMKRFFLKYYALANNRTPVWTSLIFTQQVTANDAKSAAPSFMQKFLPDFTVKGGHAGRHGKLIDIMLTNGAKIKVTDKEKEVEGKENKNKITTGKTIRWELTKGKAGTHEGLRGEVDYDFTKQNGINYSQTVFAVGHKLGIIELRDGLVTWIHNGVKHPEIQRLPYATFIEALDNNVRLDLDIREDIMYAAGIKEARYRDA